MCIRDRARRARKNQEVTLGRRQRRRKEQRRKNVKEVIGTIPVSYTHLDVYKRQGKVWS